ncbi:hypothetical protein PV325_002063 [Microctonus aethiopoides]|nr:hypothetical protein PV325_002063 [Microctonus aethiopoides]
MSLFPAYGNKTASTTSSDAPESKAVGDDPTTSWLSNTSFQSEIIFLPKVLPSITIDSSDDEITEIVSENNKYPFVREDLDSKQLRQENLSSKKSKKQLKKSKPHHRHHKHKPEYDLDVKNVYFDDKFRDKGNLKVDTLCSRIRPIYNYNLYMKPIGFVGFKWKKPEALKRYYSKSIKVKSKDEKVDRVIKRSKSEVKESDDFNDDKLMKEQNILQLKIKEFNQQLAEEPTNIQLWLQYANLEDNNEFENSHNNSDIERIKYQRKLAIIEKAMELNSNSNELLIAKLKFMSELVPADEYSQQIEALINKDPGNIILWQALITATRSSVAMCTAPRIQSLYLKCFATLHLWSKSNKESYDNRLLNILYQSLIFLRHAGLWEQMWESIRINLNLNLGITSKNIHYSKEPIEEKKLIDMEEVILTSRLPLNQLWLRIELLRENCHWMSVERDKIEFIGDSHRFISPEDIAEYIHPLLTRESNLKLVIYMLLTLKIPLLPLRHNTLKYLDMEDKNWTLDSIEPLAAIFYPCVGEIAGHKQRLLLSTGLFDGRLTSGPQYLRFHPAQEPYLDFIRNAFHIIAENLKSQDKIFINVWWLRFERMLIALQKNESLNNEKKFKKLRGVIKDFLKKEENRNNLHYYREYALIEREMGRLNNSINILKMAIQTKGNISEMIHDDDERTALISLYRTLVEILLDKRITDECNKRDDILKVFSQITPEQSETESLNSAEKFLHNCYQEFIENFNSTPFEESVNKCFLPNFHCDAIVCYIYLLYIIDRPHDEIIQILNKCLEISQENPSLQEQFHENKIIFMQLINDKNNLQKCVNEAMKKYPDNCHVLSVFATIESELPHWSASEQRKNNRLWPIIAMCLAGRARLHSPICLNDPTAMTAALNKLLRFHEKLSIMPDIRTCPLIWRLYMLLLREQNLCEKKGEEIYHASITQCPWARCIYVDAAEIAPQFLTQIQDVIREKDLRMHCTLEELDILRGS